MKVENSENNCWKLYKRQKTYIKLKLKEEVSVSPANANITLAYVALSGLSSEADDIFNIRATNCTAALSLVNGRFFFWFFYYLLKTDFCKIETSHCNSLLLTTVRLWRMANVGSDTPRKLCLKSHTSIRHQCWLVRLHQLLLHHHLYATWK